MKALFNSTWSISQYSLHIIYMGIFNKPKLQGGAPLTRRKKELNYIRIGPENMKRTPASPKLLQPLLKSILDPNRQKLAHQNRYTLNNQSHKTVLRLQEQNRKKITLKQVQQDSVKNSLVKASVQHVEDDITREVAVESSQIIIDHQVLLNC